ncbi:MAG: hypothetical protein NE327_19545 [Lentisphaeraceae bacterium]|nr:hypothetical protein [Lentisphaeraceae bacterium]
MENIMWAVGAILLLFCGVGIRILLLKDGKFRGSCSSQNITGDEKCSICGKTDPAGCENNEDSTLNKSLAETKS